MQRTANENAAYKCRIRYAAHFLHGLAMIFLRDSLCLSAVSSSRQRHDILDFSYCPLSRFLHVTLANWKRFGLEFHLRSSPSAYSGFVNIRPAEYFTACYTVLKRPNKVETAVQGCNLAFSLDSIASLPVVSALHHCLLVIKFISSRHRVISCIYRSKCKLKAL